jgi:hypothetical protein
MASIGALKVGIAVVCVAGAAGSYAVCAHLGVASPFPFGAHPRQTVRSHAASARHAAAANHLSRHSAVVSVAASARLQARETAPVALPPMSSITHSTHAIHRHMSALEQTRREFGGPRAQTASSNAVTESTPATGSPVAGNVKAGPAPASPSQIRQTQAEFGSFER